MVILQILNSWYKYRHLTSQEGPWELEAKGQSVGAAGCGVVITEHPLHTGCIRNTALQPRILETRDIKEYNNI